MDALAGEKGARIQNRFKHIWNGFGWGLSAIALGYMIYRLAIYDDYVSVGQSFRSATLEQYIALLCAVILLPIQLIVEARKWQLMLLGLTTVTLKQSWIQVLRGYVGAFITPYRLGEYPTRLWHIGYDLEQWKTHIGGWREWLLNGRKWTRVGLWHLIRYLVWMIQLWLVFNYMGMNWSCAQAATAIVEYYVIITIAPSLPAAEVACKGGWAVIIFSQYTTNIPTIAVTITLIWMINTIIPTLLGLFYTPNNTLIKYTD